MVKILKDKNKEEALKAAKEKWFLPYKGWLKADFSSETMEDRRQWTTYLMCSKRKKKANTISKRTIFQNEGEIKKLPDKKWDNLLLADPYCKNYQGKLFGLKAIESRWKKFSSPHGKQKLNGKDNWVNYKRQ